MNPKRIVIDGKTYNSVDEMPEDIRQNYEEAMRNFGTATTSAINPTQTLDMENQQVINLSGGMKFIVDGQTYNNVNELPPDARAKYEQAMSSMDKNRNGIPDVLEGMMNVSNHTSQPVMTSSSYPTTDTTRHALRTPIPVAPTISPDTSNGWTLALAGLFILLLCALGAIGVWYFYLR